MSGYNPDWNVNPLYEASFPGDVPVFHKVKYPSGYIELDLIDLKEIRTAIEASWDGITPHSSLLARVRAAINALEAS